MHHTNHDSHGDVVSVVIPTRDRRDRLRRTLTSIQNQDHRALEIIVADDGSTDGTADWVRSLDDDRLKLAASPVGTGVSNARNRGIAAATGRWIAVCDDDDVWAPDKLSQQLRVLAETGARWSFCASVSVTDDLEPLHVIDAYAEGFRERLVNTNPVPGGCSSVVVERELLLDLGGFDPRLSMFADYDVWLGLANRADPAPWAGLGVLYVWHDGQMTRRKLSGAIDELAIIRTKHRAFMEQHGFESPSDLDRWLVAGLRNAGDRRSALRCVARNVEPLLSTQALSLGVRALVGRPVRRAEQVGPDVLAHVEWVAGSLAAVATSKRAPSDC